MSPRRRISLTVLAVVVFAIGVVGWLALPTHPMGFARGSAVTLASYKGPDPTGVPAELRGADLVTRGRYLATAADCGVCHTAPGGAAFAGGLPFKTPFGTLYSPNITPDRETGIGAWSESDFLRAVHKGVAKDGSRLYPAFPYEAYSLMADGDVLAIRAYLFSLAPVRNTPPANRLMFPFNQRPLMAIWGALYSRDQRFQPHTDRSPAWNRGAYLVEAMAHCGDCHTPRNLAQAPDNRKKFGGAVIQGWRAYNITQDRTSGVGAWSDAELATYLREGHALGRGSAAGPMAEAINASLSQLAPSDTLAMVAYLRTIPAVGSRDLPAPRTELASDLPKVMAAGDDRRGREVFAGACASCHGWSGKSPLFPHANLTGVRAVNDPSAINVAQVVINGARLGAPGGDVVMPAFGQTYSNAEIAAVANYVTARFGSTRSEITARDVAKLR